MVDDYLASMFPVEISLPVFALNATRSRTYWGDHRRRRQGAGAHAQRQQIPAHAVRFQRRRAPRHLRALRLAETKRSRANNVAAFFRATFGAWKDYKRTGEQSVYVGWPIIVVDADKI
ncbi:MAG: hypothetical protein U0703_25225 [Anaerolineae bacterium]